MPCIVSLVILLPSLGSAAIQTHSGSAFDSSSGAPLYRETHYLFDADGMHQRVVLYQCQNGDAFARKHVRDGGDPQQPDIDMVDARLGYHEGVRHRGEQREVFVQRNAERAEQAAPLPDSKDGVIDAGFDVFVQRHWSELVRGDELRFPFLVPSRRTFYEFKVGKVENAANPPGLVTIRLALGSWYAFLLPHIDVSYDIASRALVRYEGLSNVRDLDGKNYRARMEYPLGANRHEATQEQLDAAIAKPLVSVCPLADSAASANGH